MNALSLKSQNVSSLSKKKRTVKAVERKHFDVVGRHDVADALEEVVFVLNTVLVEDHAHVRGHVNEVANFEVVFLSERPCDRRPTRRVDRQRERIRRS